MKLLILNNLSAGPGDGSIYDFVRVFAQSHDEITIRCVDESCNFDAMLAGRDIMGLAMENETAFVDINGEISYITARKGAKVYEIVYDNGNMKKLEILPKKILEI